MTRSVYKYFLPQPGQIAQLPAHIKPLHVAMQDGAPTLWAEIDTDNRSVELMRVYAVGTGWPIPSDQLTYIGTVQDRGGLVWHFYTLPPNVPEPW